MLSQKKEIEEIKKDIEQKKIQREEIKTKQKNYEKVVTNLTNDIKDIKNQLLTHYHKVLLEGRDSRTEGLSWIIKAIWSLGCKVIMSYLPGFLDETAIKFLFNVNKTVLIV